MQNKGKCTEHKHTATSLSSGGSPACPPAHPARQHAGSSRCGSLLHRWRKGRATQVPCVVLGIGAEPCCTPLRDACPASHGRCVHDAHLHHEAQQQAHMVVQGAGCAVLMSSCEPTAAPARQLQYPTTRTTRGALPGWLSGSAARQGGCHSKASRTGSSNRSPPCRRATVVAGRGVWAPLRSAAGQQKHAEDGSCAVCTCTAVACSSTGGQGQMGRPQTNSNMATLQSV